MKYYIWADGEEHGPYDFDQLYESWKEGTLPQGFLWRSSDQSSFRIPDELERERADRQPPQNKVPAKSIPPPSTSEYLREVRKKSNYPITRIVLKCCAFVAVLYFGISIWLALNAIYGKSPREWDRYVDWVLAVASMLTGVALRLTYEFGTMVADHTDVQIDIGRGLHKAVD